MSPIRKRPLLVGCIVFLLAVGAFLSFGIDLAPYALGIALTLLLLALLLGRIWRNASLLAGVFLLPLLLSSLTVTLRVTWPNHRAEEALGDRALHRIAFTCHENAFSGAYSAHLRVLITGIDGKPTIPIPAILTCAHELELSPGDRAEIGAVLPEIAPEHAFLPEYAPLPVLLSEEQDMTLVAIASLSPLSSLLSSLRTAVYAGMDEESAGLYDALLFGKKANLPVDARLVFSNLGISHVLSISGLHLTLLFFSLDWLLKRLTVPLPLRDGILICGVSFFTLLVSAPPSMCRAAGMFLLARIAIRCRREPHPPTTLALTIALITLVSPTALLDVGLLLSAFATAGILAVTNRTRTDSTSHRIPLLSSLLSSAAVTIGALAFSLPITLASFGTFSLMTLPANLFLSLPVSACLLLGMLSVICAPIPLIGPLFAELASRAARFLLSLARLLDGSHDYALTPSLSLALLLFSLPLAIFLLLVRRKRLTPSLLCIALSCALLTVSVGAVGEDHLTRAQARITFLSDGRNDGILLSSGGTSLYIDCTDGTRSPFYAARDALIEAHSRASIEGYLVTHYHKRTRATLATALAAMRIRTLFLPLPSGEEELEIAENLSTLAKAWGCKVTYYAKGGTLTLGDAAVTVYREPSVRSTHPLLCLQIEANGRRAVYLGASAQESASAQAFPACDLLFFGAHGPIIKAPLAVPPRASHVYFASDAVKQVLAMDGIPIIGAQTVLISP